MDDYESIGWIISSILIMTVFVAITIASLWAIRKRVSHTTLRQHHDVAGYIFSIVGVLYSVILGFTVINVQERYNKAEETVHTESMIVADLYRDAVYFDEESLMAIRSNLKKYVQYVIEQEWVRPDDETRRCRQMPSYKIFGTAIGKSTCKMRGQKFGTKKRFANSIGSWMLDWPENFTRGKV